MKIQMKWPKEKHMLSVCVCDIFCSFDVIGWHEIQSLLTRLLYYVDFILAGMSFLHFSVTVVEKVFSNYSQSTSGPVLFRVKSKLLFCLPSVARTHAHWSEYYWTYWQGNL